MSSQHYRKFPARPEPHEPPNPGASLVTVAIVLACALLSCSVIMLATWIVVSRGLV